MVMAAARGPKTVRPVVRRRTATVEPIVGQGAVVVGMASGERTATASGGGCGATRFVALLPVTPFTEPRIAPWSRLTDRPARGPSTAPAGTAPAGGSAVGPCQARRIAGRAPPVVAVGHPTESESAVAPPATAPAGGARAGRAKIETIVERGRRPPDPADCAVHGGVPSPVVGVLGTVPNVAGTLGVPHRRADWRRQQQ